MQDILADSQSLEVKVRKEVPRGTRDRTTSDHSQKLDPAICEHLNAINACVAN